jgi:hypothetical protein
MKNKPRSILFISAVYLLAPLFYLIHLFVSDELPSNGIRDSLVMFEIFLAAGSVIVSLGIWKVRPWGFYSFLIFSAGLMSTLLVAFFKQPHFLNYLIVTGIAVTLAFMTYHLQIHLSRPYFDAQIRWWETATRYRTQLKAELNVDGKLAPSEVLDISKTGCFAQIPAELKVGDMVHLNLAFRDISLQIMSKVTRKNNVPAGYGLVFLDMSRQEKNELKKVLADFAHHSNINPLPDTRLAA